MQLNVHKDAHLICHNKFEERSRKILSFSKNKPKCMEKKCIDKLPILPKT